MTENPMSARKPYSHYRVVRTARHDSLSGRVLHPRRNFPVVQIFVDSVLVTEFEVWRDDAAQVVDLVVTDENLDLLTHAAYPKSTAARLLHEAARSIP